MKREQVPEDYIVKHVQKHARYIKHFKDTPYYVSWRGEGIYSDEPRGLVKQIAEREGVSLDDDRDDPDCMEANY